MVEVRVEEHEKQYWNRRSEGISLSCTVSTVPASANRVIPIANRPGVPVAPPLTSAVRLKFVKMCPPPPPPPPAPPDVTLFPSPPFASAVQVPAGFEHENRAITVPPPPPVGGEFVTSSSFTALDLPPPPPLLLLETIGAGKSPLARILVMPVPELVPAWM